MNKIIKNIIVLLSMFGIQASLLLARPELLSRPEFKDDSSLNSATLKSSEAASAVLAANKSDGASESGKGEKSNAENARALLSKRSQEVSKKAINAIDDASQISSWEKISLNVKKAVTQVQLSVTKLFKSFFNDPHAKIADLQNSLAQTSLQLRDLLSTDTYLKASENSINTHLNELVATMQKQEAGLSDILKKEVFELQVKARKQHTKAQLDFATMKADLQSKINPVTRKKLFETYNKAVEDLKVSMQEIVNEVNKKVAPKTIKEAPVSEVAQSDANSRELSGASSEQDSSRSHSGGFSEPADSKALSIKETQAQAEYKDIQDRIAKKENPFRKEIPLIDENGNAYFVINIKGVSPSNSSKWYFDTSLLPKNLDGSIELPKNPNESTDLSKLNFTKVVYSDGTEVSYVPSETSRSRLSSVGSVIDSLVSDKTGVIDASNPVLASSPEATSFVASHPIKKISSEDIAKLESAAQGLGSGLPSSMNPFG